MKVPLSFCPKPYIEPITAKSADKKEGTPLLSKANSQLCVKAVTGQAPGQLIDLHYVN